MVANTARSSSRPRSSNPLREPVDDLPDGSDAGRSLDYEVLARVELPKDLADVAVLSKPISEHRIAPGCRTRRCRPTLGFGVFASFHRFGRLVNRSSSNRRAARGG